MVSSREQRDARSRVSERIETLHWALDTCECEAEEVNIRAALEGYASGEIGYSDKFTLIYGGHIVDVCPTYQSFCIDRSERLRGYAEKYGAGWLWSEPPLAGSTVEMLAKNGMCLDQESSGSWGIGHYGVHLNFEVDKSKVMSEGAQPNRRNRGEIRRQSDRKTWAHFKTLLDSGATVPMLHSSDLRHLAIDMRWYACQGVITTNTANGKVKQRYFEMYVSICTEDGRSIVDPGAKVTWPGEPPVLGGFLPVVISTNKLNGARVGYTERLSGMIPFDAAYISSAPTLKRMWFGEDRRDVLGASRFPAHLRYDNERVLRIDYPRNLDRIRKGTGAPDVVIFAHHLKDSPGSQFIDTDCPGQRGTSEWTTRHLRQQGVNGKLSLVTEETAEIRAPTRTPADTLRLIPGWRKQQLAPGQIRNINTRMY